MRPDTTCRNDFKPPFCPNPNCLYHNEIATGWRYKKTGFFTRRCQPHRIQRFTCLHCRRSFSTQTFSTTYWQKLPDLDRQLFTKTTGCMSNRQVARDLGVAPETINRHVARLGRHCMLFHTMMMRQAMPATRIAIDGFVTFELSQYFPFHHHLAVEKGSDFFLYFTDSEVRRSGTMTAKQKNRRQELERLHGRPDPGAVRKDVAELLHVVVGRQQGVTVFSDDHKAYPRSLRDIDADCRHRVTSSRTHRGNRNPLWEINLLDLLIRHGSANHKRETIAWSKRRQASAERLAVFLVWRNYMNGRREKASRSETPAMMRELTARRLTADDILERRIFPTRVKLPERWESYYRRNIETRPMRNQRTHELKYAA
jgi:transposase-like protein